MTPISISRTASAVEHPLLIARILDQGLANAPEQEIVYGDRLRCTYATLAERVRRLASALATLGVKPGATVAMMDWDSHRYLECFFAVPMMGAVLHTVNVRISPEQVLYTINHAQDDVILVNVEFLPLLESIRTRMRPGVKLVLINDGETVPATEVEFVAEYEAMLASSSAAFAFPRLDDGARATTFYTTGTTGVPKGVYYSHRQLVLHTLAVSQTLATAPHATFGASDVYMPITPMFHVHAWGLPYVATMLGVIIGGSALPLPLARSALERGIDIIAGYGMSETCPILTLAHLRPHMCDWDAERQLPLLCRAGRPIPLVDRGFDPISEILA